MCRPASSIVPGGFKVNDVQTGCGLSHAAAAPSIVARRSGN
jgi:hypothetical protein